MSCEVVCDVVGVSSWQSSTYRTDLKEEHLKKLCEKSSKIIILKKHFSILKHDIILLKNMEGQQRLHQKEKHEIQKEEELL